MPGPKCIPESKKVIQAREEKFLARNTPKHVLEANTPKKAKAKKVLSKKESVKRFTATPVKYDSAQKVINAVASLLESRIQRGEYTAPKILFLHDLLADVVQARCDADPELNFSTVLSSNLKQFCSVTRSMSTHLYLEERIGDLVTKLVETNDINYNLDIAVGRDDGIAKWKVRGIEVNAMRHTPITIYSVPIYSELEPNLSGAVISQ